MRKNQKTFYVLSKTIVDTDGNVEMLEGWIFSSFKNANKAMREDYIILHNDNWPEGEEDTESTTPFESDDEGVFHYPDGTIAKWTITKGGIDA